MAVRTRPRQNPVTEVPPTGTTTQEPATESPTIPTTEVDLVERIPEMNDDTVTITVDVLDGENVRYKDGTYNHASRAVMYSRDLSEGAKLLWWTIDDHAGRDRKAYPSRKRLAELLNVSDRTIDARLTELAEQGYAIITRRQNEDGSPTSNDYLLCIPKGLNVLADDYKHSTRTVKVKPKPKLANKTRAKVKKSGDKDYSIRYAISYNHIREYVEAPPQREDDKKGKKAAVPAQRGSGTRKTYQGANAASQKPQGDNWSPEALAREEARWKAAAQIGSREAFLAVDPHSGGSYYETWLESPEIFA